ncbi:MAG TPA: sigma-70 family RNA polymerase sigma factor [Actinocrinis sp.]
MNPDEVPGRAAAPRAGGHLELSFQVFVENHQVSWIKFVHLSTGSNAAAEEIVDEVAVQLAENWPHALAQDSVERYALDLVKTAMERWRAQRAEPDAFVANAAFLRALRGGQQRFALLEESIGLFSAMAELPERQFMAVALRYVLGYTDRRVALLLGVNVGTVRSHIYQARKKLARQLNLRTPDVED